MKIRQLHRLSSEDRRTDEEMLAYIRTLLGEPDLKDLTPKVLVRAKARMKQAAKLYDKHLVEAGLGPKGIVVPSPRAQLAANRRGK